MTPRTDLHFITPPRSFDPKAVVPAPLRERPPRVQSLALDISGTCNLSCRYCAEAASQPRRRPMEMSTLKAALDFAFPRGAIPRNASLRFGSGEPLLAASFLRKCIEALTGEKGEKPVSRTVPSFFLTTNGILIDGKTAQWLKESRVNVKVSLDGPRHIHDAWRVAPGGEGTYDRIASAVKLLVRKMRSTVSVTAVLCSGANPGEVFDEIAGLGVGRIELVPAVHRKRSIMPQPADVARYEEFVFSRAERHLRSRKGASPELVRFARKIPRVMGYDNQRIPCGAGRNFFAVDPEGDLYPCFRFVGIREYRLGSVGSGFDTRRIAAFQKGPARPYEKKFPCRTCWAAPLCGGPCYSCSELFGPGDGKPLEIHCAYVQADAKAAIWLVQELRKRDPGRLLSFLPGFRRKL